MTARQGFLVTMVAATLVVAFALLWPEQAVTRNGEAHHAADAVGACIAALAAVLVGARACVTRRLDQAVLAAAMTLFAVANGLLSTVPTILSEDPGGTSDWGAVVVRLLAAGTFAAAAFVPSDRRLPGRGRSSHLVALAAGAALLVAAGIVTLSSAAIPPPVRYDELVTDGRIELDAVPALTVALTVSLAFFVVASVGWARRTRTDDDLAPWLAAGALVAGAARLLYLVEPSLYSVWFSAADALRLTFYAMVALGVARSIAANAATAVTLAELTARRDAARDVHDTFAQELAALALRARHLRDGGGVADPAALAELAATAQRALDQSRAVVRALDDGTPDDGSLLDAIRTSADDAQRRWGVPVEVRADGLPHVAGRRRREVGHIVREAITNAARHADATAVRVIVRGGRDASVSVQDDGRGFDPDAPSEGFGLRTMRARAAEIDADLELRSAPDAGTRLTLRLR